jgi:endonuclease III related protein
MRGRLVSLYRQLLHAFGPQGWWPAQTPFEVMAGAILTQNTSWKNVERAIGTMKKENILSAHQLVRCRESRVAHIIRSAGYYNVKARRLRMFARFFVDRYNADVRAMAESDTSVLRQDLLSVEGIGPETADSILLYAVGKPVFVVDAYTKRLFSRHSLTREDASYDDVQRICMQFLDADTQMFNEYHALIVRAGKEYCRKTTPRCEICPLNKQKSKRGKT